MKPEVAQGQVDVAVGDDAPCKSCTEQASHHPEDGLHAQVRAAILVADEL